MTNVKVSNTASNMVASYGSESGVTTAELADFVRSVIKGDTAKKVAKHPGLYEVRYKDFTLVFRHREEVVEIVSVSVR